jgi:ubiquinone/menaquinone biosynthesis C-methylase UbiE
MSQDLSEVYRHLWAAHEAEAQLDQSLHPRSPDLLFELVVKLHVDASWTVLDVGCGRGNHACEIAQRFGCRVKGLEPVESNLELCRSAALEQNISSQVEFVKGGIQAIPFAANSFDFIWCRDMLVHIQDLGKSLEECRRVLKPGGVMLVLTTFGTDLLEPNEKQFFCQSLNLAEDNLCASHMEQAFVQARLQIASNITLGSELAEYYEERDGRYSR